MGINQIKVQSPGRINLIGGHTDYNEGYVLPGAINKKTVFEIEKNGTANQANIFAKQPNERFSFHLDDFSPLNSGWQNYVMGVVSELQKIGANISGFDASFSGDVPIGSGLSSSAALQCALAYGLNELFELGFSKWQLIKAAQLSEHNFVGTKCGIMDQFTSMMGQKDHVLLLDCRTLEYEAYPLDLTGYDILMLNTNVEHSLATSEYNIRRASCMEGVHFFQKLDPSIKALRDVPFELFNKHAPELDPIVRKRCRHILNENARVLKAAQAMKKGDLKRVGALIYDAHTSIKDDYEVSCTESDFLVDLSRQQDYVLGSRQVGGGFGGCTINIIKAQHTDEFTALAAKAYKEKFGINLTPHVVSIEDGTKLIG